MRCVIYLRVSTREQAEHGEGEEGFSIPAQREACVRHVRDKGWDLVDEYADRGESARSADRPQLKEMLARIAEDGDVDAVVVHKIDRLARNMEDHVAIRALLRRRSVTLVSVTENLEETASGRLVEGIHALMAEFYSANLASEIKKGMSQKAKMGGWPHSAPLGYTNVRETIGGRQVAHIVVDPERAPHITAAFELYATGRVDPRTPRRRARLTAGCGTGAGATAPSQPIGVSALANILANKAYAGIVVVGGHRVPGPAPAAHRHGHVQPGPGPPGRPRGTGDARAPPQPLPEGHAVLRGMRTGPLGPALEGPLRVPVLPWPEEPEPHRLPRALRGGR